MTGAAPRPRAAGQAGTEYLMVLVFCVFVLVAAAPASSPVRALLAAIRQFFSAYAFAISLAP